MEIFKVKNMYNGEYMAQSVYRFVRIAFNSFPSRLHSMVLSREFTSFTTTLVLQSAAYFYLASITYFLYKMSEFTWKRQVYPDKTNSRPNDQLTGSFVFLNVIFHVYRPTFIKICSAVQT